MHESKYWKKAASYNRVDSQAEDIGSTYNSSAAISSKC
jgi:hypothetical protein